MPFRDAVKICLQRKYADFNGRARRSEYWFFILFTAIVGIVAGILDAVLGFRTESYGGTGPVQGITQLALLVPTLAVGSRRLHDTGRTGWWQLLLLVPLVGAVILIVWWARDGEPEPNRWGARPVGGPAPQGWGA